MTGLSIATGRPRSSWLLGAVAGLASAGRAAPASADALVHADGEYFPKNAHGNNDENISVLRLGLTLPVPVARRFVLLPGAAYETIDFSRSDLRLHEIFVSVGALVPITEHIAVLPSLGGGFASDFDHALTMKEFLVNASLLGTYAFNEKLTLGLGIAYDRQSGKLAPLPLISMNVRLSEITRVVAVLPSDGHFDVHAAEWLTLGVRERMEGNRFFINGGRFNLTQRLEAAYSVLTLTAQASFALAPLLNLDAYGGIAVLRTYSFYLDQEKIGDADLDPGPVFGIRFWIGPTGWEKPPTKAPAPSPEAAPPAEAPPAGTPEPASGAAPQPPPDAAPPAVAPQPPASPPVPN